jgi:hypothetical protein
VRQFVRKVALDSELKRNIEIGHKHGKQINMINNMSLMYYRRKILHVCGYMWKLGPAWVRKVKNEVRYIPGYNSELM